MNIKKLLSLSVLLITSLFSCSAFSQSNACLVSSSPLLEQRIAVVKNYMDLLGQGKYKEMIPFFAPDAMVSDVVVGLKPAADYYNGLYAYLTGPHLTLYDIYVGLNNPNVIAAHFNMKIKTGKGIENRGEIVDLFVFKNNSTQIEKLYIQGNKTEYPFATN